MCRSYFVALFTLAVLMPASASARIIYVRADATGANNGASWSDAFQQLADGLSAAQSGDDVWVASGLYRPSISGDRTESLALKSGVGLYGGFNGTESLLEERDFVLNESVLSGDLLLNDASNFIGTEDNSYHVVVAINVDASAILDGFVIRDGRADGPNFGADPASKDQGSGLNIFDASPQIRNCTFTGN